METVMPKRRPQPSYVNLEKSSSQKDPWVIILLTFLGVAVLGGGSYFILNSFDEVPDSRPSAGSNVLFEIIQRQSSCAQEDGMNIIEMSIQNNHEESFYLDESAKVTIDGYDVNSFYQGKIGSGEIVQIFEDDCSNSPIGFCYEGPHNIKITFEGSTEELEISCPPIIPMNETDDDDNTELALGSPLTHMASFTQYNEPFASIVSEDGQALYRSGGTFIQKLDANLLQTQNPPAIEDIILAETKIYSSTLDMESAYDSLYVCSGDFGLHVTDSNLATTPELIDTHPRELWCMSLASASFDGVDVILALWVGLDDNELRIYDPNDNSLLASVRMNTGNGIVEEGIGWDIESEGKHAYIALGTAGVARVDWKSAIDSNNPKLEQGPLAVTDPSFDRKTKELLRVRDISISEGFLFAAASAQGLIEINLSNPWSKTMPTKTYLQENIIINQYPVRVNALKDTAAGSTLVFAQSLRHPRFFDWGPHVMYGAWDWESSDPSGSPSDLNKDLHTYHESDAVEGLLVLEKRNLNLPLRQVALADPKDLETMTFHQVDGTIFGYTETPAVYEISRNNLGEIQTNLLTDGEEFIQGRGGYIEGEMSLIQPDTIIGMSDAGNHAFQKLSGNPPTFSVVPGTFGDEHNIGVFSGALWKVGSNKEFVIVGGAGEMWPLLELTWANGFPSISKWFIPVNLEGPTDQFGYDSRSYTDADYDPETGLVVMVRSQAKEGGFIMDSQNIYGLAKSDTGSPAVYPEILTTFVTHEEAPNDFNDFTNGELLYTLSSTFFKNSAGDKMVAIAAGSNVDSSSPNFQDPMAVLVSIPDPFVPGEELQTVTFHGVDNPSAAVDAQVFDFEGEQMLILAGEGGDVSLHNIEELPEVLTGEVSTSVLDRVAEWHMRDQPLDGRKVMATDLVIRNELVNGEQVTRIYVASNNEGIYILEVKKSGSNWELEEIMRLNTIYQTVGISLEEVDSQDVLVAYDHFGGMAAFIEE